MSIEKVLVVEHDRLLRDFIVDVLHKKHIETTTAETGQEASDILDNATFDLVLTALRIGPISGMDVLRKAKELNPATTVIIITAIDSAEKCAEAMRLGAFSYVLKPFSAETLEAIIEKASEHVHLVEENKYLRHQVSTGGSNALPRVIGESAIMKQILAEVMQVAKSNASVLIHGESGTGKEVIAHTIHYNSPRANKPFIKVNCAAMPETLIESEFFGHEKGAFTGAGTKRLGRFELANGGSLLLDEITEIPLLLQAKLLRAVQEQEFERIGGTKPVKVNVRFISTSNRDVQEAVANKILREDLFYRLNVIPIHLPPLRERREDILPLAQYFLEKLCLDNRKAKKQFTEKAKKKLIDYSWPGNIRELANIIERAVVLDSSTQVDSEHLQLEGHSLHQIAVAPPINIPTGITLEEMERRFILQTLEQHENDNAKAAQILGITPRTLSKKLMKTVDRR